jgi:HemY protein
MRIALNANLQSERWDEALKAVRLLEKRNALHPVLAGRLKCTIYRELLTRHNGDPTALEAVWRAIPDADRQSPGIALEAARLFNDAGLGALAAESIESGLHDSPAEWDESAGALLEEYGRANAPSARDQLERVEAWLKTAEPLPVPIRAALLHAAGAICLRQQLWGKSKAYLLESLAANRSAATLLALARLANAIGDEREAAGYFKEAAIAFAAEPKSAADTAAGFLRASQR